MAQRDPPWVELLEGGRSQADRWVCGVGVVHGAGTGWAWGKEGGPRSRWARGEGKKRRWRAGPLRVLGWMLGLGFLVSFSFSISISKQLKPI